MRTCPGGQFLPGFGEGDVQASFTAFDTLKKVLQSERGFARAGVSFDKIKPMRDQSAI
jgi:hypothetical protein